MKYVINIKQCIEPRNIEGSFQSEAVINDVHVVKPMPVNYQGDL